MSSTGSISEHIKFLYSQYQGKEVSPSIKQKDLIVKLGGDDSAVTTSQAQKQIRFLMGNQKITIKQQKIARSFPKNEIDTILHKNVIIEDMTRFELMRVMNTLQNRHNLCPKVYNHPIISTTEYEYGWQESDKCPDNKMYYIVYYDLLMVDIDGREMDISILNEMMVKMGLTGRLYHTYNGYHIFITSHHIHHKLSYAKQIMMTLGCDLFYITFAFLNGFKVRLNPKKRSDELMAAEYQCILGAPESIPENERLVQLLYIHDKYLEQHKIHYSK